MRALLQRRVTQGISFGKGVNPSYLHSSPRGRVEFKSTRNIQRYSGSLFADFHARRYGEMGGRIAQGNPRHQLDLLESSSWPIQSVDLMFLLEQIDLLIAVRRGIYNS